MDMRTERLLAFLDASPSVYHAAANIENELKNAGYTRLNEAEKWQLAPGGKYYLTRGGSAVLAFRIPQGNPKGFMLSASHSDRPTFKVKENGELGGTYTRLATERYGGMIIATWLDRPLSVAGRVLVETERGIESKLINIDRDLLLICFYAIQIYGDFTGGIDIAIGLSEALGISLPDNFIRPYFSKNIAEYWRRWHITLGEWLKYHYHTMCLVVHACYMPGVDFSFLLIAY